MTISRLPSSSSPIESRVTTTGPWPEPMLAPSHDMLGRQVRHLVRLVDDLLDVSRITRGKITLRTERIDLVDVAGRALETARPLAAERRQRLEAALPDRPLIAIGDPVRLAQVVGNLLANAIKYTGDGGRIELAVDWAGDGGDGPGQAVVRVTDTGVGIDADVLPNANPSRATATRPPSGTSSSRPLL